MLGRMHWDGANELHTASARGGPLVLWFDGTLYESPNANDAAALLGLIEARGLDAAIDAVEGDFVLALWDERTRRLQLARDRFGLRPMYWVRTAGGAAFASRIRSLFDMVEMPVEPREAFVARYAASHYRTFDDEEERSPFEGVMQVPAGCVVEIDARQVRTRRYWSLQDQGDLDGDEAELAERLRELLHAAVAQRIAASEKPMFTLSGGMDSSSVLFTAARAMSAQPVACSAVYEHHEYDESSEIRESLAGAGIDWQPIEVSNELDVSLLAEAIRLHGEPLATSTWLAHFQVCKAAARLGATELLDGLGGDELNAGEYEYFPFFFADLRAAGADEQLEHEITCWARLHDHPIHRKSRDVALAMMDQWMDGTQPGRCKPNTARTLRYVDLLDDGAELLRAFEPRLEHPFGSFLKNRAYQDLTRETMPCCLRASERNATSAGLVNRSPFLDRKLVEFMFRVPGELKIRDGVTKHLLREAMRGVLPEATRRRVKKVGWNAPSDRWFVGAGAEMMRDLVSSQEFRGRGVYRTKRLLELIDEHEMIVTERQPRENHMMLLWQVLNLELWWREVEVWRGERARSHRRAAWATVIHAD